MLFKKDSLFGHVIEDTEQGPVYVDDRSPVDRANPRSCLGCNARCSTGSHDPCIAGLPGTYQACCGHGLELSPVSGKPNGYVGLTDGRTIEFSGLVGGARIREAVQAALSGEPLPEGFTFGQRMWWEGLDETQRAYVWQRIPLSLPQLVRDAGAVPSEAFLRGEQPWWDGLSEEHKQAVWAATPAMIAALVVEALAQTPEA